jgi:uncharacterized membrane protein YjfL (UPF0719 family)
MEPYNLLIHLKTAGIFALMGLLIMGFVWLLLIKILPFSMRKEMEEDQNVALGIVLGSLILGISIIIAAAIHG